jgi:hypothetical protein
LIPPRVLAGRFLAKPGEEREALDSTSGFGGVFSAENLGRSAKRLIPPRVLAEQFKGKNLGRSAKRLIPPQAFADVRGRSAKRLIPPLERFEGKHREEREPTSEDATGQVSKAHSGASVLAVSGGPAVGDCGDGAPVSELQSSKMVTLSYLDI